jgi:hypothetical protein
VLAEAVTLLVEPPAPLLLEESSPSSHAARKSGEAMTAVTLTIVRKKCRIEGPF